MDYFLEEAAGLRKTRAGSAEAPRAPWPPTSRRRCLDSLWCVRGNRRSNANPPPSAEAHSPHRGPASRVPWVLTHAQRPVLATSRRRGQPAPGGAARAACSLAARAPAPRSPVAWGGGSRAGDSQDAASLRQPLGCTKASSRAPHRGAGGSLTWAWPTPWGRSCLM